MLAYHPGHRYYLYAGDTDMRKGSYALSGLVVTELDKDPLSGEVFIFFGRGARSVKILCFEGDGYGLYQKRLEKGTFERPQASGKTVELTASQLRFLMEGIVLKSIQKRERYHHPACG